MAACWCCRRCSGHTRSCSSCLPMPPTSGLADWMGLIVDALAALKAECERECVGDIFGGGGRDSSGSVALGSRAGRESSDRAVDRGAAGFATLQADVVAAMAEAGQRGSRGMRQPPSGGDQLFQPGALIALEQFDHACDLRALAGRGRIDWHTSDIAKLSGSMLPKHDPQIEAVCADGTGRVLLLQETPPRVELIDPEALSVVASIDLAVEGRGEIARAWSDPS